MDSVSHEKTRATVLVVDDTPINLSIMTELLQDLYEIKVATSGKRALQIAQSDNPPDLLLLDVMMPEMSGYEVCSQMKANPATQDIPIIFLTSMGEAEDEKKGFDLGAADYITKPISPPIVLARVKMQLQMKAFADFLKDKNCYLEHEVAKRTRELTAIQDVTIQVVSALAETRDTDTGFHIRRTQYYVRMLARKLSTHPRFRQELSDEAIATLFKSAPLHDVGKVGIPDSILLKPGRLTSEEFEVMKTHSSLGSSAIELAEKQLGVEVKFLSCAKKIARSHHEKWDGTGYPDGLAGEEIPMAARIMAVADVYDALISRRVYKEGMPHEKAMAIMIEGRGSSFDPDILDAFVDLAEEFRKVAARYADADERFGLNETIVREL